MFIVLIPAETYLSGNIRLRSNVILHLMSGAVLKVSDHLEDYTGLKDSGFEEADIDLVNLITARGEKHIAIEGITILYSDIFTIIFPSIYRTYRIVLERHT